MQCINSKTSDKGCELIDANFGTLGNKKTYMLVKQFNYWQFPR